MTIKNILQHYLNPLHVQCRLLDIHVSKKLAKYICLKYQNIYDKIL